jgi:NAD(P)-dependent dehydrogenase (short-subunit alcohol dehydrogenase family)
MSLTAFVTGADRGLGLALSADLLQRGWRVYAGQFMPDWPGLTELAQKYDGKLVAVPLDVSSIDSARQAAAITAHTTDRVDMVINNAGILSPNNEKTVREPQDYAAMHREFDINTLGPLRMVEAFLPLLDHSDFKRLCFVSSEAGSIGKSTRTGWYGYCMSKAALNMAVKNLFNLLRPDGYSFRLYHPGWMRTYMEGAKNMAAELEPEEAAQAALRIFLRERDENTLVLEDYQGNTYPW